MKIIIKRSFERTRQIADFIPVKAACEATIEYDDKDLATSLDLGKSVSMTQEVLSRDLDEFVQSEVEKTLMGYTPCCIRCGAKQIFPKKALNKEGYCGQCISDLSFQAKDFREGAEKNARSSKDIPSTEKGRNYKEI